MEKKQLPMVIPQPEYNISLRSSYGDKTPEQWRAEFFRNLMHYIFHGELKA